MERRVEDSRLWKSAKAWERRLALPPAHEWGTAAVSVAAAYPEWALDGQRAPALDGTPALSRAEVERRIEAMPIYKRGERAKPPRLGIVRLGEKVPVMKDGQPVVKNGQPVERPKAFDHFGIDHLPEVVEGLGGDVAPRTLPIFFLFEEAERTFPHYLKAYGTGGLIRCMGDGQRILRRDIEELSQIDHGLDTTTGEAVPCPYEACPMFQPREGKQPECRPTGRLCFGISGVDRLGYYQLTVHSMGIDRILGSLAMAVGLFGQVVRIPWLMHLEKTKTQYTYLKDGKPKRGATEVWVPWLEVEPGFLRQHMAAHTYAALEPFRAQVQPALLGAGKADVEDEEFDPLENGYMTPEQIAEAEALAEPAGPAGPAGPEKEPPPTLPPQIEVGRGRAEAVIRELLEAHTRCIDKAVAARQKVKIATEVECCRLWKRLLDAVELHQAGGGGALAEGEAEETALAVIQNVFGTEEKSQLESCMVSVMEAWLTGSDPRRVAAEVVAVASWYKTEGQPDDPDDIPF